MAPSSGSGGSFDATFERLKGILEPYGRRMHVADEGPTGYSVDMAPEVQRNPTTWFGGVRRGKAYVSYYLMPVYVDPELAGTISPALRKRMQGKSCFNFRAVDEPLFAELEVLTRAGYEKTAGDPAWGAAHREQNQMAYRKAMSKPNPKQARTSGASGSGG